MNFEKNKPPKAYFLTNPPNNSITTLPVISTSNTRKNSIHPLFPSFVIPFSYSRHLTQHRLSPLINTATYLSFKNDLSYTLSTFTRRISSICKTFRKLDPVSTLPMVMQRLEENRPDHNSTDLPFPVDQHPAEDQTIELQDDVDEGIAYDMDDEFESIDLNDIGPAYSAIKKYSAMITAAVYASSSSSKQQLKIDPTIVANTMLVQATNKHPIMLQIMYDVGVRVFVETSIQDINTKAQHLPDDILWCLYPQTALSSTNRFDSVEDYSNESDKSAKKLANKWKKIAGAKDSFATIFLDSKDSIKAFHDALEKKVALDTAKQQKASRSNSKSNASGAGFKNVRGGDMLRSSSANAPVAGSKTDTIDLFFVVSNNSSPTFAQDLLEIVEFVHTKCPLLQFKGFSGSDAVSSLSLASARDHITQVIPYFKKKIQLVIDCNAADVDPISLDSWTNVFQTNKNLSVCFDGLVFGDYTYSGEEDAEEYADDTDTEGLYDEIDFDIVQQMCEASDVSDREISDFERQFSP